MTATFNADLSDVVSRVRQRIGDTDVTSAQVQDMTISGYLTLGYSELRTAIRLCYDLAAKWASVGDVTLDRQLSQTSKIYDHYIALAATLEAEERKATPTASAVSTITVGGLDDCRGPVDFGSCW